MAAILRDATKPNLLQTLEHTPVLVHAGPFGNIAHGNSSVLADLIGIHTGDYLITEAGFGADMGAERFFNIKCRNSGLHPDAAVVVATVRALKAHSGRHRIVAGKALPDALLAENPDEVHIGGANLRKQIDNIRIHGVSPVVAINAFPTDHPSEWRAIEEIAAEMGARAAVCQHFAEGGRGATDLAEVVAEAADEPSEFTLLYPDDASLREKIEAVATKIYGADGVTFLPAASRQIDTYERNGFGHLPVCIAKTHLSISSDPTLKGAPTGWTMPVREVRASVGAGFIYPLCGEMRTMPGLGTNPAAFSIDVRGRRHHRRALVAVASRAGRALVAPPEYVGTMPRKGSADAVPPRRRRFRLAFAATDCDARRRPAGRGTARADRLPQPALLRAGRARGLRRRVRRVAARAEGAGRAAPGPGRARFTDATGTGLGRDDVLARHPPRADDEPRQRLRPRRAGGLGCARGSGVGGAAGPLCLRAQDRRAGHEPALRTRAPRPGGHPR